MTTWGEEGVELQGRILVFLKLLFAAIVGLSIAAAVLYFQQDSFIYYPTRCTSDQFSRAPNELVEISFQTSEGAQVAFYRPPLSLRNVQPARLWMLFSGQAGCSLNWLDFVANFPDKEAAFLLLDYPGFGKCDGSPSAEAILESSEAAFVALAEVLGERPTELEQRTILLGESLGTGPALEFAAERNFKKIVLFMPYTSIREAAWGRVGPVSYLLRNRFDNRARLNELSKRENPPKIVITSGTDDRVVPGWMGAALAREFSKIVHHIEVQGGTHNRNHLFAEKGEEIYAAMID